MQLKPSIHYISCVDIAITSRVDTYGHQQLEKNKKSTQEHGERELVN